MAAWVSLTEGGIGPGTVRDAGMVRDGSAAVRTRIRLDAPVEFVNFRSKSLADALGTGVPPASGSNIGAMIYNKSPRRGSGTSSTEVVNRADVGIHSHAQGQRC